jgi:hypothetical protein
MAQRQQKVEAREPEDELVDAQAIVPSLLMPGSEYCFRVLVEYATEGDAHAAVWAYTLIKAKSAPSGGYCELESPNTGIAFTSLFRVACHGWTADPSTSGVLLYAFYKRTKNDAFPLAPASTQASMALPLDVGHATLEVHVSDEHGATTVVPVKAVSARIGGKSREDFMDEQIAAFHATGNVHLGYQVLPVPHHHQHPSNPI